MAKLRLNNWPKVNDIFPLVLQTGVLESSTALRFGWYNACGLTLR